MLNRFSLNKQPSFLGRWLAGGPSKAPAGPPLVPMASHSMSDGGEDREERALLVKKLKEELGHAKEHFDLTANQVRLLLNLPVPVDSPAPVPSVSHKSEWIETVLRTAPEFMPPPVEALPKTSKVFDSWDLTSSEDLDQDEVQAIMLALSAAEDHPTSDKMKSIGRIPATLSHRMVSVQRVPTEDANTDNFTVTFAAFAAHLPLPPPTMTKEEELRLSGSSPRPALACRQYSIQPFPTSTEEEQQVQQPPESVMERPSFVQCRQASVQLLPRDKKTGDASFVVSLPVCPQRRRSRHVAPGLPIARQVSCQRRRLKKDGRPIFRMNGQKVSFQVEAMK